jgi:hypothetical protein
LNAGVVDPSHYALRLCVELNGRVRYELEDDVAKLSTGGAIPLENVLRLLATRVGLWACSRCLSIPEHVDKVVGSGPFSVSGDTPGSPRPSAVGTVIPAASAPMVANHGPPVTLGVYSSL